MSPIVNYLVVLRVCPWFLSLGELDVGVKKSAKRPGVYLPYKASRHCLNENIYFSVISRELATICEWLTDFSVNWGD